MSDTARCWAANPCFVRQSRAVTQTLWLLLFVGSSFHGNGERPDDFSTGYQHGRKLTEAAKRSFPMRSGVASSRIRVHSPDSKESGDGKGPRTSETIHSENNIESRPGGEPQTIHDEAKTMHSEAESLRSEAEKEGFEVFEVRPSKTRADLYRRLGAPTLTVSFLLGFTAEALVLKLPPGYELASADGAPTCPFLIEASEGDITSINTYIKECSVDSRSGSKEERETVTLHFSSALDTAKKPHGGDVWTFTFRAWLPLVNPKGDSNIFHLLAASSQGTETADLRFLGWPVLGDWDCVYSDWTPWGACSAKCGGGSQRLTREVKIRPPPGSAQECNEPLSRDAEQPCNTHRCVFPCKITETVEGNCSARCGGGVIPVRHRWEGDDCPNDFIDPDAVIYKRCNTHPCKIGCRLASTWTVVSNCSERCGAGIMWLMREVIAKDADDASCGPEWKKSRCMVQSCDSFTVFMSDLNALPLEGSLYDVGIVFETPFVSKVVRLEAPLGYRFATQSDGNSCSLRDHSFPLDVFESCNVDASASNRVTLTFSTPGLDKSSKFRFLISVMNAACDNNHWYLDEPAASVSCRPPPGQNTWEIRFSRSLAEHGDTWKDLTTSGYHLFPPTAKVESILKLNDGMTTPESYRLFRSLAAANGHS